MPESMQCAEDDGSHDWSILRLQAGEREPTPAKLLTQRGDQDTLQEPGQEECDQQQRVCDEAAQRRSVVEGGKGGQPDQQEAEDCCEVPPHPDPPLDGASEQLPHTRYGINRAGDDQCAHKWTQVDAENKQ